MMRHTRRLPPLQVALVVLVELLLAWTTFLTTTHAFTITSTSSLSKFTVVRASSSSSYSSSSSPVVVVISPPGGVGEVAAVKAASLGSVVKWFVVSSDALQKQQQQVTLSSQTLEQIAEAGGKVELAGSSASSLLLPTDDPNSALPAVSAWLASNTPSTILCTLDGIDAVLEASSLALSRSSYKRDDKMEEIKGEWTNALKVAARQAASSVAGKGGRKIAVLSALEDEQDGEGFSEADADNERGKGVVELMGSLLGGGKRPSIPDTLTSALSSSSEDDLVIKLRHGDLFGTPESSPLFSALQGGPRKVPELCEEYTMRSVRVDPTLSMAGNLMMGKSTRSSRHAVGEAAALLALGMLDTEDTKQGSSLDVCVSSQRGFDPVPLELWNQEFQRAILASKGSSLKGGAQQLLFSAEFSSVPDIPRLADWLATKWAPAILRTYDIAAIRVGARPVYATRVDTDKVEIVWQQLVDFTSINVGKMILQVSDKGLIATRGPGDANKGFGEVSRKPLAGEDVLVRRLAEATSQAIEKGLAKKPLPVAKPLKKEGAKLSVPSATTPVVTSIQDSGTVVAASTGNAAAVQVVEPPTTTSTVDPVALETSPPAKTEPSTSTVSSDQGPRQSGARRSTERKRGKRIGDNK